MASPNSYQTAYGRLVQETRLCKGMHRARQDKKWPPRHGDETASYV